MKIGGVEVKACEEILVLPRLSGDIVIKAHAVKDMDLFHALCPSPTAPGVRTKDGFKPNVEDKNYLQLLDIYSTQRLAYIVIKSLEPSCIEWEKVKLEDPTTWTLWSSELTAAGLSDVECQLILRCVLQANSLDEEKLKEARSVFLRGQGV